MLIKLCTVLKLSEIDNKQINDATDLDGVMLMYNLMENNDKSRKLFWSL